MSCLGSIKGVDVPHLYLSHCLKATAQITAGERSLRGDLLGKTAQRMVDR